MSKVTIDDRAKDIFWSWSIRDARMAANFQNPGVEVNPVEIRKAMQDARKRLQEKHKKEMDEFMKTRLQTIQYLNLLAEEQKETKEPEQES